MNEHEFQQLIERYQRGECTPNEKQKIETWLNTVEKQPGRFEEWEVEKQQQVGHQMLNYLHQQMNREQDSSSRRIIFAPLFKVAASLLLIIGLGYFVYQFIPLLTHPTLAYQERTSNGSVSKHILSDGTIVWLKGNSKLSFPSVFTGEQREVQLEGEALFEVAKDASHPFIIHCGSLSTKVLGTSFNIKSTPGEQVEVVVFTGKVSLSPEGDKQEMLLLPQQKAVYQSVSRTLTKTNTQHLEQYQVGTQYNMEFEDTPLWHVIERIEQKFNIDIDLQDQKVKHCLVSADLTDQSLAITLKLITQALGGYYQQQGKNIQFTIPRCS